MSGERDVRKRLAALERRMATLLMLGTAEQNQGAKTKVRFDDAGAAGEPFSSPYLSQTSASGKNGSGVSKFTKIGTGESVIVLNPGGEIGQHSRVMSAGPVGDHPSPGASEADGDVTSVGNATFSIKDGEIKGSVGGSSFTITAGAIELKAAAIRLVQG